MAVDGFAVLLKDLDQRALAKAEPIAIGRDFVVRVDRCDRIFQVHDGRQRGLNDDIGNARRIGAADRMCPVNDHFNVQAIVDEQDNFGSVRAATIAAQLPWVRQSGCFAVMERG